MAETTELEALLQWTVRAQVTALEAWDADVRRDAEDSVHQLRVSARRLRSVLQLARPLLDDDVRTEIANELRALGRLASAARDAEVVREEVDGRLAALPGGADGAVGGQVPAAVVHRLRQEKSAEYATAHDALVRAMNTASHQELTRRLDSLARQVPVAPDLTAAQLADAGEALRPLASAALAELVELASGADGQAGRTEQVELLHEVRKKAKRLRYALSAVQDSGLDLGPELEAAVAAAERLQDVIGAHRDSLMLQEHILASAARAAAAGEDTFGYGLLYGAGTVTQQQLLGRAGREIRRFTKKYQTDDDLP